MDEESQEKGAKKLSPLGQNQKAAAIHAVSHDTAN
jgi:hypothetical protein